MENTWIVIADASHAVIYEPSAAAPWRLLESHRWPASTLRNGELAADAPGRTGRSIASDGAHAHAAMAPVTAPREVEKQAFARHLATHLELAARQHAYARVLVCAAPHFLGLLRKELGTSTRQCLLGTVDKDLAHQPLARIQAHLQPLVERALLDLELAGVLG